MTDYYVSKTGNDTTGTGTSAAPWLTIDKAVNTVSLAGGHTIWIGAGTYAESTSGLNYLYLLRTFTDWVVCRAIIPGTVTITDNSSAVFTVRYGTSGIKVRFQDVVITQAGANSQGTIVLSNTSVSDFIDCTIYTRNWGVYSTPTAAITTSLTRCTITKRTGETGLIVPVYINCGAAGNVTITMTDCICTGQKGTGAFTPGVYFSVTDETGTFTATIDGGTFTNDSNYAINGRGGRMVIYGDVTATTTSTPAIVFGDDSSTTLVTTGFIQDTTVTSTTSHSLLIGQGCSNVRAFNTTTISGDHGIVVKGAGTILDGVKVRDCTLSAVYFKAAINCTLINSALRASSGCAVFVSNDPVTLVKSSYLTITDNHIIARSTAGIFNFASEGATGDGGGSIVDRNHYYPEGSDGYGTVYGTTGITTLAGLRAAWDTYSVPTNDETSTQGATGLIRLSVRER